MRYRPHRSVENSIWLELRAALWPETPREELAAEMPEILANPEKAVVVFAEDPSGEIVGFAEISIREGAEGCSSHPVGYVEGWFVRESHRRRGVGRGLLEFAEKWLSERGCTEIASDAEIDNELSHRAHRALGFAEVSRVVLYAKPVGSRNG
ncbi:MAG: GNAT family N-acetyltransferase [Planctomycetes bacterium]|nr:GNAT family N-acetyltransferase [Planctomycetota bacterium]